jgi:hypothetical protein
VKPEYVDLIERLIKVTDKTITDSRTAPLSEIEEMDSRNPDADSSIECVS